MSVSVSPQQCQIPAFTIQKKQFLPNCGVETFDEQSDTGEGEFIALKKELGTCKGWAERNKERLQQERSAHADEIRRIKENHQQEKDTLTQRITCQLKKQHKQEIAKLKETHEKIIAA